MSTRWAATLAMVVASTTAASAFVGRGQTDRVAADTLTAMPAAGLKQGLRAQRDVQYTPPPSPAWLKFALFAGGSWHASWDIATAVPNRIWGSGIPAPGANADPAIAEAFARQLLAEHIALLAPGAQVSDFVLVTNHSDGDIRSVGFKQFAQGMRVVGGQLSFRFKADRMFVIGSEALPYVKVERPFARLAPAVLATRATTNLRDELALPTAPVTAPGAEVILPLVGERAVLGYRVAVPMTIDGGADGKYLAYVDPASGAVLAVHQQNLYATGKLLYRSVDRYPSRPRVDVPANTAHVSVGGAAQTTTGDGMLSWSPDAPITVTTSVLGKYVTIVNKESQDAPLVTAELALAPAGSVVWDTAADEKHDAQVQTFIATNIVKDYVRTNIDAGMRGLDEPLTANVNIAQACNAFFDGSSINFFHKTAQCENTGLLQDVVYHEFGHALHVAEIIEGVGGFDGALSEGAADFLAAIITNDPGMGRGFFHSEDALRHLDPDNFEATWPRDIAEIHKTGLIYGGTFWDLRKALLAAKPAAEAHALVHKLYLATLRRSVNIPSSMIEALAADDDDGNLANGTPNECFIRDAYGRHGLRTATGVIAAPGALASSANAVVVRVDLSGLSERCQGDEVQSVGIVWKPGSEGPGGAATMTKVSDTRYWAQLPLTQENVTFYQAQVKFTDASTLSLPDNLGDQFYSIYSGTTVPLYCTTFDTDPFAEGWTTGASEGAESPWQWGPPTGRSTDPPAAYTGSSVLGMNLDGDYKPKMSSYVQLPELDVGHWSDVRLQYRRWLAVEDAHFDQARVTVNDVPAWINFDSNKGDSSSIHHIDREWRFHDVPLSGTAFSTKLRIAFDLTSDEGLHLGGWHIDELCVVANVYSVCGDGVVSPTEECDDGAANANAPGKCRTYCRVAACGDRIIDEGETCDDGPGGSDDCNELCQLQGAAAGGGCCSANRDGTGAAALAALLGAFLFAPRRRRRAARPALRVHGDRA